MTVDVEDYFQVEAFFPSYPPRRMGQPTNAASKRMWTVFCNYFRDKRVNGDLLHPGLGRQTLSRSLSGASSKNGHELASHGLAHISAPTSNRALQFLDDVSGAKDAA